MECIKRNVPIKSWGVMALMLTAIIGFGPFLERVVVKQAWVPIDGAIKLPGFKVIERLPAPFELNYPGAAKVWIYEKLTDVPVYLVVVFYQEEAQGEELVGSENGFLNRANWRYHGIEIEGYQPAHSQFSKRIYRAVSQEPISVLSQYRFSRNSVSTKPLQAKLYALRDTFLGSNGAAQVSIIFPTETPLIGKNYRIGEEVFHLLFPAIESQVRKPFNAGNGAKNSAPVA
jgi:hypothetical protein